MTAKGRREGVGIGDPAATPGSGQISKLRGHLMLDGQWQLYRTELRPPGANEPPDLERATLIGTVSVPGTLQLQLGIPDPWLDAPEVMAVNRHSWLYLTTFLTPAGSDQTSRQTLLAFDRADYFCDVWVNGRHVGAHEGAFTSFELDVTGSLRPPGEDNELTVAVSCPWIVDGRPHALLPSTRTSTEIMSTEYMKGNLLHCWDALPLSGRAVLPFGLSGSVRLVERSGVVLRHVSVATIALADGRADLELRCEWWSGELRSSPVNVEVTVQPETFVGDSIRFGAQFVVEPGISETRSDFSIVNPHLWWTWDLGAPDLYRVTVEPKSVVESVYEALVTALFGVRDFSRDETTLCYMLNGHRLFLRGVWYPFADMFSGEPSALAYERDVEMLVDANVNHLVVFTFVEPEVLYAACDRLGILVFQQLPFQQSGPMQAVAAANPRRQAFTTWALEEVGHIVRELRGHASLGLWAPFAETRKAGRWLWVDYTAFTDQIAEIVRDLDPDALFHPSLCDFGEDHVWNGAMAFGEYTDHYDRAPLFVSEFGAMAPPIVETLRELLAPDALWGKAVEVDNRINLPIAVEEYAYLWSFDYPGFATSVARSLHHVDRNPPTVERFVDSMQWYQAFLIRYAAEAYRRRRFSPIAGVRMWSYRDVAPGAKFTVVDHRQRPKMGYQALREAYAPLLLSLDDREALAPLVIGTPYSRELWLVNDGGSLEHLDVEVQLIDVRGAELGRWALRADVSPDEKVRVGTVNLDLPQTPGAYLLRLIGRREDRTEAAASATWLRLVRPAFDPPLRLMLLGQRRYNDPILEALRGMGGVEITVTDEVTRLPEDPSWSAELETRFDVLWFTGWDGAAREFHDREWQAIADSVTGGLGLIHSGGQGSFHGGDGRASLLDCTPLAGVLPVVLLPHDTVWDRVGPPVRPESPSPPFDGLNLETLPAHGFSRTTAQTGAQVHWTAGGWPLLVTRQAGRGHTVAFTGALTPPLRSMDSLEVDDRYWPEVQALLGAEMPLVLPVAAAPWERNDIRAYGPYWRGLPALVVACLAYAADRPATGSPQELADELAQPTFELLASMPEAQLEAVITAVEWDAAATQTRGVARVRNRGDVVAYLVRGAVTTSSTVDHRFRDGFIDLLPGETASLRFEAACPPDAIEGIVLSAQNTPATVIKLDDLGTRRIDDPTVMPPGWQT